MVIKTHDRTQLVSKRSLGYTDEYVQLAYVWIMFFSSVRHLCGEVIFTYERWTPLSA